MPDRGKRAEARAALFADVARAAALLEAGRGAEVR
jgi:hypothetical protein